MSEQAQVLVAACRRQLPDRRQANMRSLLYAFVKTRRQSHRRHAGFATYYSDHYGPYTLTIALLVMVLSIVDTYFTLILIGHGSSELNPILAWALDQHVYLFFLLKYSVTAACVVLTVMHKQFRVFGCRGIHILLGCLLGYIMLVQYQLSMLINIYF